MVIAVDTYWDIKEFFFFHDATKLLPLLCIDEVFMANNLN